MQQLELNVYRSMMANLPRIADSLEQIAKNATPQPNTDFEVFEGGYEKYKESNPDAHLSQNMYGLVSSIFAMFKQYGDKGVSTYLLTGGFKHDLENTLDHKCRQISWCIGDFESHAEHIESNYHDGKKVYDRDSFEHALDRMIDNHDATIGITWDTIGAYLDDHCRLGGE